jgi:hypothetical protein
MALHYHTESLWVLAGMIALGLLCIIAAIWVWWHRVQAAAAAARWPSVVGEVRSVEIVVIPDSDGPDRYEPRVSYRYRAAGGIHDGNRLRVGAHANFIERIEAQLAIQPYRPGERVTVYYDPDRPARSVLEPVPTPTGIPQWLWFGGFLLVAAAYCFVTITWPSPFAKCPSEGHACPAKPAP